MLHLWQIHLELKGEAVPVIHLVHVDVLTGDLAEGDFDVLKGRARLKMMIYCNYLVAVSKLMVACCCFPLTYSPFESIMSSRDPIVRCIRVSVAPAHPAQVVVVVVRRRPVLHNDPEGVPAAAHGVRPAHGGHRASIGEQGGLAHES